MNFAALLNEHDRAPGDVLLRHKLAEAALRDGEEAVALDRLVPLAGKANEPRLWQWIALLYRAIDHRRESLAAFERGFDLAPNDPGMAQGLAQVSLEAGLPAVDRFEAALRLAPLSGEVVLGLAAANFSAGQCARAVAGLEGVLLAHPHWTEGHEKLVQLRWMLDERHTALRSFEHAISAMPSNVSLWQSLVLLLLRGGQFAQAEDLITRARRTLGDLPFLAASEAVVRSELGHTERADTLFAGLAAHHDEMLAVFKVRHLIRNMRVSEAAVLIDGWLPQSSGALWPYASIVWRLTGDRRWPWFEGDPALISVVDLADRLPPLERLVSLLRGLHQGRSDHLDQSVRGGTQTDGQLLARIEPEIEQVRNVLRTAVADHVARLPQPDKDHPILGVSRNRVPRFSGSWSVRLTEQGYHKPHVHPNGWISSALYIALPDEADRGTGEAGWLTLGVPEAPFAHDLPPIATVEPKPGRLVLFPSTMWHGTKPILRGERLTIAFDVATPPEAAALTA